MYLTSSEKCDLSMSYSAGLAQFYETQIEDHTFLLHCGSMFNVQLVSKLLYAFLQYRFNISLVFSKSSHYRSSNSYSLANASTCRAS